MSSRPAFNEAMDDLASSVASVQLWSLLGWYDVKQRYRRSVIGPFWLTISMGVTVTALGLLYSRLFGLDVTSYIPFLAIGFILWQFIAGVLGEAGLTFVAAEGLIKQARAPLASHVLRVMWRNLIILGHNMLIYVVVLVAFDIDVGLGILAFIPALIVVLAIAFGTSLMLATICTRFRDVGPLVQNFVQLSFFMTPVIWKPELLPERTLFLELNPFYHVMELLRAPLLGEQASTSSWVICGVMAIGCMGAGILIFARFRRLLPYWL